MIHILHCSVILQSWPYVYLDGNLKRIRIYGGHVLNLK